jgi:hypothetical protein
VRERNGGELDNDTIGGSRAGSSPGTDAEARSGSGTRTFQVATFWQ